MGFKESIANFYFIKDILDFLKRKNVPGLDGISFYVLLRIYLSVLIRGALTTRAAAVSWSLFLSLFPFLLFVYSWLPYLPNFTEIEQSIYTYLVDRIFPVNEASQIENYVSIIARRNSIGIFTILIAILFATNGINSIFTGFGSSTKAVKRVKPRDAFSQYVVASFVTVFFTIALLLLLWLINYLAGPGMDILGKLLIDAKVQRYVILTSIYIISFTGITFGISALYYFGVVFNEKFKKTLPGAIVTTFLLSLLFTGFSFYIENFNNYNLLYGSLSTLLLVMLFLYISNIILLLGFELNMTILYVRDNKDLNIIGDVIQENDTIEEDFIV